MNVRTERSEKIFYLEFKSHSYVYNQQFTICVLFNLTKNGEEN